MIKDNINEVLEKESSQVQIISKPLKLETVNEGSNEDDVLVRGTDNTVKYVPQSELGGGGSQTLKQTLDNGTFASFVDSAHSTILHAATLPGGTSQGNRLFMYGVSVNTGQSETLSISLNTGINLASQLSNKQGILQLKNGRFNLSEIDMGASASTNISFKNPIATDGTVKLKFPAKNKAGEYILATLDDIPESSPQNLQQTLENGGAYSSVDGFSTINLVGDIQFYKSNSTIDPASGNSTQIGYFYVQAGNVGLQSENINLEEHVYKNGIVGATNGNPQFEVQLNRLDDDGNILGNNTSSLYFQDNHALSGSYSYKIPAKPVEGEYTLATTDDINLTEITSADKNTSQGAINFVSNPESVFVNNSMLSSVSLDFTDNTFNGQSQFTATVAGVSDLTGKGVYHRFNKISFSDGISNGEGTLFFDNVLPNSRVQLNLPFNKPAGTYEIATTDDSLPYTGAVNDLNMGGKVIKVGLNDATPATVTTLGYSNGLSGFVSDSPGSKVSYDMQRIEVLNKTSGYKKSLYYNVFGDKDYILSLPNKSGELATTDDIAVSNNTSTALSSTFLNATYPDAVLGFQVICDSLLSSGGEHTIYVKSRAGWLKILGEPVP